MCSSCEFGTRYVNSSYCEDCPPGTFGQAGYCTACPKGEFSYKSKSVYCQQCNAGFYTNIEGSTKCEPCEEGFSSYRGSSECYPCAKGTRGRKEYCQECIAGDYSDALNSTECKTCPLGTFSRSGASQCISCASIILPPFSEEDTRAAPICTKCPGGTIPAFGGCMNCPAGTVASQGKCVSCNTGEYSLVGSSICENCLEGTFSVTVGAVSNQTCKPCGSGTFASKVASTTCLNCESGTFANRTGMAQCDPCPLGSYSFASATYCYPCQIIPSGEYEIEKASMCSNCTNGTIPVRGACKKCALNMYQNGTHCAPCPSSTNSDEGMDHCVTCTIYSKEIVCIEVLALQEANLQRNKANLTAVVASVSSVAGLIIVGIIAFVVIFLVVVLLIRAKRRISDREILQKLLDENTDDGLDFTIASKMPMLQLEEISNLQELAVGGSNTIILKGNLRNKQVVVKLFRMNNEKSVSEFENELNLLA